MSTFWNMDLNQELNQSRSTILPCVKYLYKNLHVPTTDSWWNMNQSQKKHIMLVTVTYFTWTMMYHPGWRCVQAYKILQLLFAEEWVWMTAAYVNPVVLSECPRSIYWSSYLVSWLFYVQYLRNGPKRKNITKSLKRKI